MPRLTSIALTRSRVERARHDPAGPQQQYLWDNLVPGLGLQILPSGRKSWCLRYRLSGTARRMVLGAVGALALETARDKAREALALVAKGVDPLHAKAQPDEQVLTVAKLLESYTATPYYNSRSESFRTNFSSTARLYILPGLGAMPVAEVRRAHLRELIDALTNVGKDGAAHGLRTGLRVLFRYAIDQDLIEHSPADRIRLQRSSEGRRPVWLQTPEELRSAWWLDAPVQLRAMVRWCLLTGCRRDEARLATWSQFNKEPQAGKGWTVPRTKNGRPLSLPVNDTMDAVLSELARSFPGSTVCFPGTTSSLTSIARTTGDAALRRRTKGRWMWHALRHTVESHLAELGIPSEVRNLILNHTQHGVGERYRHGRQLDLKREALEVWHRFILDSVT